MRVSNSGLFISGISAALDISFSPLLIAVMTTRVAGHLSSPWPEVLAANMYSIGFIFVVLGRSELFAEQTTLVVLPMLNANKTLRLHRGIVIVVKVIGGIGFAATSSKIGAGLGVIELGVLGKIASAEMNSFSEVLMASAVLAGWLRGLLSRLVATPRETISQIFIVWLITSRDPVGLFCLPRWETSSGLDLCRPHQVWPHCLG